MKKIQISLLAAVILIAFSCKEAKKKTEEAAEETQEVIEEIKADVVEMETIQFQMEAKSGSDVSGIATFSQEGDQVTMVVSLTGLSEGEHAIHLHEKADCSSDDGKSTGGHWNPTFQPHGKWGDEGGYHMGDIGNFTADSEGKAVVEFTTDKWCIGCDDDTKNIVGKAIIVHQGVDDFTSQPSGAAGARIACTGIIQ